MDFIKGNAIRERLEKTQKQYEEKRKRLADEKNEAVRNIEKIEKLLIKEPDFDIKDIKKVAEARASIRHYTETMFNIEKASSSNNDYNDKTKAMLALAALGTPFLGSILTNIGIVTTSILAFTFVSSKNRVSNIKKISEFDGLISEFDGLISEFDGLVTEIDELNKQISNKISELSKKHNDSDNSTKYNYTEIVDIIISLCKKINKEISYERKS